MVTFGLQRYVLFVGRSISLKVLELTLSPCDLSTPHSRRQISKLVFTFIIGAFQNSLVALQVLGARQNFTDEQQRAWAPQLASGDEAGDERTPLIRN